MIIKIDNRETTLIPLIEKRFEIFMNSCASTEDIHEGVDDGIDEEDISNNYKSSLKSCKTGKNIATSTSSSSFMKPNIGCLVPLHVFSDVEMIVTTETACSSHEGGKHVIKKEQLAVGDIILENDKGEVVIIFERKTLYDLAASIRDGRYNEQSFRLDKENIHNHNIVYIIEGDIERYIEKKGRVSRKTLISCMFSLLYYKGFSVFRTNSICETADVVVFFADKYYKTRISDKSRLPYYRENDCHKSEADVSASASVPVLSLSPTTKGGDDSDDNEKYCAALKSHKEKNEYITPDNINIIMLTCVPGISSKVATQLMREYKTIQNLLYQLEKKPDMLNTFMIKTESSSPGASAKTTFRKINKTSVENIKKFLMTNAACAVSSFGSGSGST
jgi:ERCC4-type nuclease